MTMEFHPQAGCNVSSNSLHKPSTKLDIALKHGNLASYWSIGL